MSKWVEVFFVLRKVLGQWLLPKHGGRRILAAQELAASLRPSAKNYALIAAAHGPFEAHRA